MIILKVLFNSKHGTLQYLPSLIFRKYLQKIIWNVETAEAMKCHTDCIFFILNGLDKIDWEGRRVEGLGWKWGGRAGRNDWGGGDCVVFGLIAGSIRYTTLVGLLVQQLV